MEYKFFKLFKAQWGWRNERVMILTNITSSLLLVLLSYFSGGIDITVIETGEQVTDFNSVSLALSLLFGVYCFYFNIVWFSLKASVMGLFCLLLCYMIDKYNNPKDIEIYNQALAWRLK